MKQLRIHKPDGPTCVLVRKTRGSDTKETYIKRVRQSLVCSSKRKKEILRDLEEIFSSAAEHGQSDAEVMARLGAAEDYAKATEEELGVNRNAVLRRRALLTVLPPALLAPLFFLMYKIVRPFSFRGNASIGIIGGADGPTSILITSTPASPLAAPILLTLCILCAAAAIAALAVLIWKKKR